VTETELLEALIAAGTPPALIAQVAQLAAEAVSIRKRRSADAARQREARQRRNVTSREVTGQVVTSPSPSSPPSNGFPITLPITTPSSSPTPDPPLASLGPPSGGNARKGSCLPINWLPIEPDLVFARQCGLDSLEIQREIEKFGDYWHAKAGSGAAKRDWSATWRNWVRKAIEDGHRTAKNGSGKREFQDDRLSASRAAGRLAEAADRGEFQFGPRPSLLPAERQDDVRVLPKGRSP